MIKEQHAGLRCIRPCSLSYLVLSCVFCSFIQVDPTKYKTWMKGWVLGVSRYALACNISQAYLCAEGKKEEGKKHEAIEVCQKLIQKGASPTDVNRDGYNFIGIIVENKLDHFLQTFGLSRNEAKIPAASSGSCFSSSHVAQAVAKPVAKKKLFNKIFSKFQKKH